MTYRSNYSKKYLKKQINKFSRYQITDKPLITNTYVKNQNKLILNFANNALSLQSGTHRHSRIM